MRVLTNQTLYQCDHCGKRLLSKNGAKLHEEKYCRIVREQQRAEQQKNCPHNNISTHWTPIFGEEWRHEPDHDYCVDCGKVM